MSGPRSSIPVTVAIHHAGDSAASLSAASIITAAAWLNAVSQACFAVSFQRGAANRCSVAINARLNTS